jgi:hypothetical protein
MNVTKEMVDRFLVWPVPADVFPDGTPGQPGRTGTNLLTATQARAMLEHVLGLAQQPTETITSENNELLRTAANALLRQIEICDFMDSNGLEAKMLKARHDLMRILGKGECESVSDKSCKVANEVGAKVIGVGRDAENDRVMVVYFDKPPSNDRLRGLNEMLRARDELSKGYCSEGDRCVCGGDLPRVREGCANWVTPNV